MAFLQIVALHRHAFFRFYQQQLHVQGSLTQCLEYFYRQQQPNKVNKINKIGDLTDRSEFEPVIILKNQHPDHKHLFYQSISINWCLSLEKNLRRLQFISKEPMTSKAGRPTLGVTAKEITLLPQHWQWLNMQAQGASATLRQLVEQAIAESSDSDIIMLQKQQLSECLASLMQAEDSLQQANKAIFQLHSDDFQQAICHWPTDIHQFAMQAFEQIKANN